MVRLRVPEGVTHVYTLSGRTIMVTSLRIIEVSAEDAAPLRLAGWSEVEG